MEEIPLLQIEGLQTSFKTDEGIIRSVHDVSLSVYKGEVVGIVGESGCGKSVTALSVMQLIAQPPGIISAGQIRFKGEDLLGKTSAQMRKIRGNEISMIFQEPMTSLNPAYTIGNQLSESLRLHLRLGKKAARERAIELLQEVGITRARQVIDEYPHRLSGGMRQRVMIAMAMACHPELLIADEPTTALDVTIQAQILDLMRKLQMEYGTSIILITHDLGVVAEMCERVIVMYAGRVVEETDVVTLFQNPKHPYTVGLLQSMPRLDEERRRLHSIPGNVPNPLRMPKGCAFAPRCQEATEHCWEVEPGLVQVGAGHLARCWLHQQAQGGGKEHEAADGSQTA